MGKKERIFPLSTVGGRIQDRRNKLGLSRSQLYDIIHGYTEESGYSGEDRNKERAVYNWESGKFELGFDDLITVCQALHCSSDYILGLDECTTKTTQFISDYTGLSEGSISCLHGFVNNDSENKRLKIIDYFLNDVDFTLALTDEIEMYVDQYCSFKHWERINLISRPKSNSSSKNVFSKILVANSRDSMHIAQFKVQKQFDNIIENLAHYFYQKFFLKKSHTTTQDAKSPQDISANKCETVESVVEDDLPFD
jgi:hypothetical protein